MEKIYKLEMSAEEIAEERREIEKQFRTMKFTEQMKEVKLTCAVRCNVRVNKNNYTIQSAEGMDSILKMDCFNRCMNIKLEQGPFIKDLGEIGEDKVPVMFMWPNGMYYTKNGPAKVVDHTFY